MAIIERLEEWLLPLLGNRAVMFGEWYSFSVDAKVSFAAITQVGGRNRSDDLRWPHFMVTVVSTEPRPSTPIRAAQAEILGIMDSITKKAQGLPDTCKMLKVNPVGEVVGPSLTQSGRIVATVTLEVITTN